MKKIKVAFLIMVSLVACGKKKEDNRSDYENTEHIVRPIESNDPIFRPVEPNEPIENVFEPTTPDPFTDTPTPTLYISTEDIMNSFHREENIIEVEFEIVVSRVYDKPYSGKQIGYLVNETFRTENLYWSDHNNMVGFDISCVKHFYEPDERSIIHPIENVTDDDGVVWVYDNDAIFTIVPHPENYNGVTLDD